MGVNNGMRISVNRNSKIPIYLQIRNEIRELILSKVLDSGFRLPPERKLALTLGVNRSTVVNAYRELEADGFIESHVGRGTIIKPLSSQENTHTPFPDVQPLVWKDFYNRLSAQMYNPVLNSVLEQIVSEDIISFAAGVPAYVSYPAQAFEQIFSELTQNDKWQAFEYSSTAGHYPLREYLSEFMRSRGIQTKPENILILSGSQQGLDLVARVFLEPGDTVVVEEPTYLGAISVFQAAGARVVSIPMDEEGLRIDMLEQILSRHRPKLIYTLPTFQNPSGISLSPKRRHALLQLAYRYHVPILEDDPYGELYYEGEPPRPLKALDQYDHVLYLSTFSKILFPGLRLGWCVAPSAVIEQLTLAKQLVDLHAGTTAQWVMDRFCRQGRLERHLAQVRKDYAQKRNTMIEALEAYAPPGFVWNVPQGGFYLWCQLPVGVTATSLLNKAAEKRVAFLLGNACYVGGGGTDRIRLCFSRYTEETIREGIQRICMAMKEIMAKRTGLEGNSGKEQGVKPIV